MSLPSPPEGLTEVARELGAAAADRAHVSPRWEFQAIEGTTDPGWAAAVDAGSSLVLDRGSLGLSAVRAGWSRRGPGEQYEDRIEVSRVRLVRRSDAVKAWNQVLREHAWGSDVAPPSLRGPAPFRAWLDAERSLVEFDAAMRSLRHLPKGALLVLDGALDEQTQEPALQEALLRRARASGVFVAALSKDTTLSLGGTLPFTLELEEEARRASWPDRFWVDLTSALARGGDARTLAARFDRRGHVYRVDLEAGGAAQAGPLLARLAALCNDPAYPGYPYPLARIHGRVHYSDGESADLKGNLEARIAERRGSLFSMRLFGRGRDVLALGG